jgi:hypothetical protein
MITLSKVSKWYPNFSGAESLLDGSRQGRSRRGVRSIGLWQVDAHQMRQRWRDLASTVRSEPDSASGSHGHALRRRGERNAGNGARRGRHVHVHHDGSGRVLAEWGKPSTSTTSPRSSGPSRSSDHHLSRQCEVINAPSRQARTHLPRCAGWLRRKSSVATGSGYRRP